MESPPVILPLASILNTICNLVRGDMKSQNLIFFSFKVRQREMSSSGVSEMPADVFPLL